MAISVAIIPPDWRSDPVFSELLSSAANSDWLKSILRSGCERDPVDVIHDLRMALGAFEGAFDRAYAQSETLLS